MLKVDNPRWIVLVLFSIVSTLLISDRCLGAEDKVYAYQVKTVLKSGAIFDAVVTDRPLVQYFQESINLDLEKYDPEAQLTLHYIYGMNGYMKVKLKNVDSVMRLLPLKQKQLSDMRGTILQRINVLNEREKVRLAKIKEEREKRRIAEMEKKAELEELAMAEAVKKAAADKIKWILQFPPEKGWGPEMKEKLYVRSMVIGEFPNDEEQTFLDHYSEWLAQFVIWEKMIEEEEARKAEAEAEAEAAKAEEENAEGTAGDGQGEDDAGAMKEKEKSEADKKIDG